jgi:hypothetical protein
MQDDAEGIGMMRIDHVVRGVPDLDSAGRWLEEEFGLASVVGGKHDGWGTGNRIVPLGGGYVELIGVVDDDAAAASPIGRVVAERVEEGDRWLCWCVATDDVEGTASRLGLEVDRGSRVRPDGTVLGWRSAGFPFALSNPTLPFFIAWEVPPNLHPGSGPAGHRIAPTGIAWIEVGDDPRLAEWLRGEDLPVRTVAGPRGVLAVGISTTNGEVVLR